MFDKTKHYPLPETLWDSSQVREAISGIASDAIDTFDPETTWPVHPMDGIYGTNLYMGSTGVLWALDYLHGLGAIESSIDYQLFLPGLIKANRESFKMSPHPESASYLFGELPLLMMQYGLSATASLLDNIYDSVQKNNSQPVRELMWGVAGTMLVARHMHEAT